MRRFLKLLLLFFPAFIALGGCKVQNRFLYFPNDDKPTPQMLKDAGLQFWRASGSDYRGLIAARDVPAPQGTMILFHGNGGTAYDRGFYIPPFETLGFRVILAEYPKYGGRPGKVGEKSFVADGIETVRLAHEQFGEPLYLVGESLGCGVAASVVKQTPVPVAGLVLITPWDTLAAVAKSLFPFLPVQLVLTDKYDSIANLKSFSHNIAVVAAERDEILPVKHAINLYNHLPEGKKKLWMIRGAGHNDWPMHTDISLFREVADFLKIDLHQ